MKRFLLLAFLAISAFAFGQNTGTAKKWYAYYYVPLPGIVAVDPDGAPRNIKRDTVYRVFVEWKGKPPQWKYALAGGKMFALTAISQKKLPVKVGESLADGKAVIIKPAKGNNLYELEFGAQKPETVSRGKSKFNELVIAGFANNKPFCKAIVAKEIASPLFP
jgi:hypothetical protein